MKENAQEAIRFNEIKHKLNTNTNLFILFMKHIRISNFEIFIGGFSIQINVTLCYSIELL